MPRRLVPAAALALAAVALVSCGRAAEPLEIPPAKVPVELAPAAIEAGRFVLVENRDESTVKALVTADTQVLSADGRLWEIRDGQRLIGTLQMSTVKPKLDLLTADARESIIRQLMPGSVEQLVVGDIVVFATASNDKIVYLWFARTLYAVLQVKGSGVDPESILNGVVEHQLRSEIGAELLLREDELADEDER